MLILKNNHPPMRKLTQPWKLRRSFGSQPVGNVAGPRWPEAGIARVIPALPRRWTFTKVRAPLPTCRIWSRMTTGVPARATSFVPSSKYCPNLQLKGRVFHFMTCLQSTITLPRPQLLPRVSSDVIARY